MINFVFLQQHLWRDRIISGRERKLKELRENMLSLSVSLSLLAFPISVMAILALTLNFYWEIFWHVFWYSDAEWGIIQIHWNWWKYCQGVIHNDKKCVRTCKPGLAFLQNSLLSQCPIATDFSKTFFPTEWYSAFFKPSRHTRKEASGVVGLFLAIWTQLVYSHHSTAAWEQ